MVLCSYGGCLVKEMLFGPWLLTLTRLPKNGTAIHELSRGPTAVISRLSMRSQGLEVPASLAVWEAIWAGALVSVTRAPAVGKEGPDFQAGMISCPSLAAWRSLPLCCSLTGEQRPPQC